MPTSAGCRGARFTALARDRSQTGYADGVPNRESAITRARTYCRLCSAFAGTYLSSVWMSYFGEPGSGERMALTVKAGNGKTRVNPNWLELDPKRGAKGVWSLTPSTRSSRNKLMAKSVSRVSKWFCSNTADFGVRDIEKRSDYCPRCLLDPKDCTVRPRWMAVPTSC